MNKTAPAIVVAIALATAGGLSGCAPAASDITVSTSELMQSTVVAAADQAAAGDPSGSLSTLDALQAQLDSALGSGEVSASRAQSIQEAIDLVRADLQPAPASAPESTSAPAPETVAPVETPVETSVETSTTDTGVPGPADESGDDTDSGPGNSGKGGDGKGNNGNGKGNDGNGAGKGPGKN